MRNTLTSSSTCSEQAVCPEIWFSVLKKMLYEVFVEALECLGMSLMPQPLQKGWEHSQPQTGQRKVGEDVESTAGVSTKASLSPPRNSPSQANYCSQHCRSKAGQEMCSEGAFPMALRWILFHEGSLCNRGELHGNREQVPLSHPLLQTSPTESTLLRECRLQIYLGQVHTGASNIGHHFAFSFFWLLAFLSGKQEMPRIVSCFFFCLFFYLKTP